MAEKIKRNGGHDRETTLPNYVERVKSQIWTCNKDGTLKQLEERKLKIDASLENMSRIFRNLGRSPMDDKHLDKVDEISTKLPELRKMRSDGDKLEIQIREIGAFRGEFEEYRYSLDAYLGNIRQVISQLPAHIKRLPIDLDDSYLKNVKEEIDSAGTFYSLEKFFSGAETKLLAEAASGLESRFPGYSNSVNFSGQGENVETLINKIKKSWTLSDVSGEKISKNIDYVEEVFKKYLEEVKGQRNIAKDKFTKEYLSSKESLKSLRTNTFRGLLDYSGRLNREVVELDGKTNSSGLWSHMSKFDVLYGASPVFGKIKEALKMHNDLSMHYAE